MEPPKEAKFVCPECGMNEAGRRIERSMPALLFGSQLDSDPWIGVLSVIVCGNCGYHIPAHLGELWNGLSETQAETDWRQNYRKASVQDDLF